MQNLKINGTPTPYWCVVVPVDAENMHIYKTAYGHKTYTMVTRADKKIIFRELKSIREKADLMIFAMQNDTDFPLMRDLDELDAVINSSVLLKSKIKELIISKK